MLGLLVGALVLALGAMIGFTVAFARPLPTGAWVGLGIVAAVSVLLAAAAFVIVLPLDRPSLEPAERAPPVADGKRRILVVADEAIGFDQLREEICERALGCESEVLVVAPALSSPLERWTSEVDRARAGADARMREELAVLADLGVEARGEVGAGDPLQAVDDALRTFPADEVIVSTHTAGSANWLEEDVPATIREVYGLPVTHVTVG